MLTIDLEATETQSIIGEIYHFGLKLTSVDEEGSSKDFTVRYTPITLAFASSDDTADDTGAGDGTDPAPEDETDPVPEDGTDPAPEDGTDPVDDGTDDPVDTGDDAGDDAGEDAVDEPDEDVGPDAGVVDETDDMDDEDSDDDEVPAGTLTRFVK